MEDQVFDFELLKSLQEPFEEIRRVEAPQEELNTSRKRFTQEEDANLKSLVAKLGVKLWDEVALYMPNRTARQCRDRYNNYLFKEITHQPWTPEEDRIILEKYKEYGSHWVKIAKFLNGRSGNNVKNRWHKYLNKKTLGRPPENVAPQPQIDLGKEIGLYSTDIDRDFFAGFYDQTDNSNQARNMFGNVNESRFQFY